MKVSKNTDPGNRYVREEERNAVLPPGKTSATAPMATAMQRQASGLSLPTDRSMGNCAAAADVQQLRRSGDEAAGACRALQPHDEGGAKRVNRSAS